MTISCEPETVPTAWRHWLEIRLLTVGVALLLVAAVCFVAWNWNAMRPALRMALPQGGLVLCVLAAALLRKRPRARGLALLAAAVLACLGWVVFSQIYQTGADSWKLFALCSLCVAPWLILGRTLSLWALWMTLLNVALVLRFIQTGGTGGTSDLLPVLAVDAFLWAVCLLADRRARKGQAVDPPRGADRFALTVLLFLLACATVMVCDRLLTPSPTRGGGLSGTGPAIAAAAVLLLAAAHAWRSRRRSPAPLFLLCACGFPLLNCLLMRMVDSADTGWILLMFTVVNAGCTALVVHILNVGTMSGRRAAFVLAGAGGLLTGLFLTAFTIWLLLDLTGRPVALWAAAILYLAAGVRLTRNRKRDTEAFRRVLSLVLGLAGLFFLSVDFADRFGFTAGAVLVLGATAALYAVFSLPEGRFLSSGFALSFFLIAMLDVTGGPTAEIAAHAAFLAALFLCWLPLALMAGLRRFPSGVMREALMPGIQAGVVVLALFLPAWSPILSFFLAAGEAVVPLWAARAAMGVTLFLLLIREVRASRSFRGAALAAPGLALLLTAAPPELLLALLLIGLGHAAPASSRGSRSGKRTERLGEGLLVVFLFAFYATMDVAFSLKTRAMALTGLILLAGAAVAAVAGQKRGEVRERPAAAIPLLPGRREILWILSAVAVALATLAAFSCAVHEKERLRTQGKELLLPLAPVDPRSLIQGDYMALRYELEDETRRAASGVSGSPDEMPGRAWVVIRTSDEPFPDTPSGSRPVGRLVEIRVDGPGRLAPGEFAIPLRLRLHRLHPDLPNSFLFREGDANVYAAARYGVFRCLPAEGCLLTGLADADGRDLQEPKIPFRATSPKS